LDTLYKPPLSLRGSPYKMQVTALAILLVKLISAMDQPAPAQAQQGELGIWVQEASRKFHVDDSDHQDIMVKDSKDKLLRRYRIVPSNEPGYEHNRNVEVFVSSQGKEVVVEKFPAFLGYVITYDHENLKATMIIARSEAEAKYHWGKYQSFMEMSCFRPASVPSLQALAAPHVDPSKIESRGKEIVMQIRSKGLKELECFQMIVPSRFASPLVELVEASLNEPGGHLPLRTRSPHHQILLDLPVGIGYQGGFISGGELLSRDVKSFRFGGGQGFDLSGVGRIMKYTRILLALHTKKLELSDLGVDQNTFNSDLHRVISFTPFVVDVFSILEGRRIYADLIRHKVFWKWTEMAMKSEYLVLYVNTLFKIHRRNSYWILLALRTIQGTCPSFFVDLQTLLNMDKPIQNYPSPLAPGIIWMCPAIASGGFVLKPIDASLNLLSVVHPNTLEIGALRRAGIPPRTNKIVLNMESGSLRIEGPIAYDIFVVSMSTGKAEMTLYQKRENSLEIAVKPGDYIALFAIEDDLPDYSRRRRRLSVQALEFMNGKWIDRFVLHDLIEWIGSVCAGLFKIIKEPPQ
jgi:hypothetical protein